MIYALQHIVMPNLSFGAPEEMYVRLHNDKVHAIMSETQLLFQPGGRVSLDTFFNSITIQAWKKHCRVDDVQLRLKGCGHFIIRFGLHRIGHAHRWLSEHVVTLEADKEFVLPVDVWSELESGMLYFTMEAIEPGYLKEGYFATTSSPNNDVKLGIVITHFNRKEWVLPAIERIRSELLSDPLYKDHIELVVVDNSRNITAEEAQGITLLPNKNLGGSGGFTRGLLYLKDQQDFTHCLFMDDDASCEIEAIRRAFNFIKYSQTQKLAISGSLLREIEPYRLFEKGAKFNRVCMPLKSGLDMRHAHDLLLAEQELEDADYGGWWFFCFAIKDVQEFPFPFFVRGDDSRFSIANRFDIFTMNAISSFAEDFALKAGPLPAYLDMRYHILHSLTLKRKSPISITRFCAGHILGQIFSYNYASAEAMLKAINDSLAGPETFLNDLDAAKARQYITALGSNEKMIKIERKTFNVVYYDGNETRMKKIIRYLTLNGTILPKIFLKKSILFQHKSFRGRLREVYGYSGVLYEDEPSSTGYKAEFNRKKAITLLFHLSKSLTKIMLSSSSARRKYEQKISCMTSEKFWRDIYTEQK